MLVVSELDVHAVSLSVNRRPVYRPSVMVVCASDTSSVLVNSLQFGSHSRSVSQTGEQMLKTWRFVSS